eukprot:Em0463g1a
MPLHVLANFGGFLCECAWPGKYISLINLLKASLVYAADSAEVSYTVARSHSTWGTAVSRTMGFSYHKRGSILLSVSIRTGKYAGGTKMYFSFVRIWLVSTNKSITRGHTKLVLGNRLS